MKRKIHFITIFCGLIFSIVFFTSSNAQVIYGSFTCINQAQVNSWGAVFAGGGYTIIGGSLYIQNSTDITDLTPLNTIESIQGNFQIHDNTVLTNIDGLENITSVGGELYIAFNDQLTNFDGLQSLASIGGTIQITNNALLTNLYGLGSLTSVGVTFSIDNNAALENLGLGSLASVVGNLVISNNDALTNTTGTGSLISVGGALEIANNDVLTDLDGLDLSSVGGDFIIQGNAALTNLDGLESLSSIGGNLQINNNALLINLDGLGSLTSVDGNHLNILYNTVLVSFCGLYPLLNTQETIYWNCNNNGANPTVADIIAGGPCPPLPVELISFTASTNNSIVELHWQTETEVNNYGFEILRCSQNTNWLKIGFLEGYGNSNSPKSYSFTDKYPTGGCNFKYKLKQIDNDGSYEYSTEIEVKLVTNNFNLYQNYPNPFNPETKISYTVPKTSDIVMKVFDILGIEIETLFSEQKQTGTYEITWNAEDLPSGVYFYRIQAGSFVETKKMVLMK